MPQLDALRAFAVGAVLVTHLYYASGERAILPWGFLGVRLFFVLSGFLITGILLDCKKLIESGEQSMGLTLRRFYLRRALRILPAFYAAVIIVAIAGVYRMREAVPWHLMYLSNFLYAADPAKWRVQPGFHFWSLAVEEQFYLVWPWIVLGLPRARLATATFVLIAAGPLYRACAIAGGLNDIAVTMLPFGCLDTLGAGALLALIRRDPLLRQRLWWISRWLVVAALLVTMALMILRVGGTRYAVWTIGQDVGLAIIFAAIIDAAATGVSGTIGKGLSLSPLLWIGKISYGIYVYHMFMVYPIQRYGHRVDYKLPHGGPAAFVIVSALTIFMAAVSWYVMERPLNVLKRYFPYQRAKTPADTPSVSSAVPPAAEIAG
jgi:peptidoglycan/LPS O-acetylase OafA/YrhL